MVIAAKKYKFSNKKKFKVTQNFTQLSLQQQIHKFSSTSDSRLHGWGSCAGKPSSWACTLVFFGHNGAACTVGEEELSQVRHCFPGTATIFSRRGRWGVQAQKRESLRGARLLQARPVGIPGAAALGRLISSGEEISAGPAGGSGAKVPRVVCAGPQGVFWKIDREVAGGSL
jgi:hypothetical protein